MKILVTGVNGFVGKHLARCLVGMGIEVDGVTREQQLDSSIQSLIKQSYCSDLVDSRQVKQIDFSPYDAIIHLAGLANVGESYKKPGLYMQVNVEPLRNIGDRLLEQGLSPRLITISTGAVYDSTQPMPLTESGKLAANGSPYAQSKIAMEKLAHKYTDKGLRCVVVRPFNHIGPGQARGFILPDMYYKLKVALAGGMPIKVGDLSTKRDYTDVRDVVRAYALLAEADSAKLSGQIYNVCSGVARSGSAVLAEIKQNIAGANEAKLEIDPTLLRPNEAQELRGSYELIRSDAGWSPRIAFEKTIKDFILFESKTV